MKEIPTKKNIFSINLNDKKIFLRSDLNVPLSDGKISDDYKLKLSLPTIKELINCKVSKLVIGSHLGRPKNKEKEYSMEPIIKYLNLEMNVNFVLKDFDKINDDDNYVVLENLRFYKEEDEGYGNYFKDNFDYVVMDAFGAIHRNACSITGTGLPVISGLLVKRELESIKMIKDLDLIILGGSKVSDKLKLIKNLNAKKVWIVGAMCFTLLKDLYSKSIGKSKYEENIPVEEFKDIHLELPIDFVALDDTNNYHRVDEIPENMMGVDIGIRTLGMMKLDIETSKTIFWNGPPGIFEKEGSSTGTIELIEILKNRVNSGGICVVGGGDTAAAVCKYGDVSGFTHVSTGGGALLTLLENGPIPGIDVILDE